ncbi:MAG TPA: DUF4845 domain-containing protein [Acinetobacter lwoffii]|uniref:DUF4845 domain-containing protein n=1 Tax=Acinetobacter lwoffii TaxID=28090 RepID=A0A9D3A0E3_ACILW|nr:DUF4845 domain-containing protein [Acinetobacter lwoffii]
MKHQQGASYIGILVAIVGFAFLAKVAIAVWGPYFDDRMLDNQVEELLKTAPTNMTPSQFSQQMDQRLQMNNIRDLKFDDIARVTNTDGLQVHKNYEIRKNFVMNIDLVMKFEKEFDQSTVKTK